MTELKKLNDYLWEIPQSGKMNTAGRIFATDSMMKQIREDNAPEQVANVACLPGIVGYSLAMPDIHWGYGFPIGGVAAFDIDEGVISPGGVGYDINCGVRLMRTSLEREEVAPVLQDLVATLFHRIPSGVGSSGPLRPKENEFDRMMVSGARWAVKQGFGDRSDLKCIEEEGTMPEANPDRISKKARQRGKEQLGTLGSGNHFVEVGYVEEVYDEDIAETFGLRKGGVTVIIHTGSRGFGHQVCEDHLAVFNKAVRQYGIDIPDRQLCCAPVRSEEGLGYLEAMACAVNFGFANRQIIGEGVRRSFEAVLHKSPSQLGMEVVYEVAHNIAKIEEHEIDGKKRDVCVHRKGATRAFPAGHPEVPEVYRDVGQPVLIPGDMGRYSYVLAAQQSAMEQSFGSTCHGAGRVLSRRQAKKQIDANEVFSKLAEQGIVLMAQGKRTVVEEVSEAYKDVSEVVQTVHQAGISTTVARLRPMGVIKG